MSSTVKQIIVLFLCVCPIVGTVCETSLDCTVDTDFASLMDSLIPLIISRALASFKSFSINRFPLSLSRLEVICLFSYLNMNRSMSQCTKCPHKDKFLQSSFLLIIWFSGVLLSKGNNSFCENICPQCKLFIKCSKCFIQSCKIKKSIWYGRQVIKCPSLVHPPKCAAELKVTRIPQKRSWLSEKSIKTHSSVE